MADRELEKTIEAGPAEVDAVDDFAQLLQKEFRPTTNERKTRIQQAVQTLAAQALENAKMVGGDVYDTVDAMKAELDAALSKQINEIIHNPDFQKLESAWRGLWYLVGNTSTGKDLKIRVLNVSKDELGRMFRAFSGASWDQSPLFKKVYQEEFGQLGGQPYGAFICDYYFDHRGPDIAILKGLSQVGAAAHAPFISAAGPTLLGMESCEELSRPRDLQKTFEAVEYRGWNSLRDAEDSRYLALTLPRFLGRPLYGADSEPVDEFAFEEDTAGGSHENYLWVNAAYGMGLG